MPTANAGAMSVQASFLKELHLSQNLSHPNVLKILAYCNVNELSYLTPLLENGDLKNRLDSDKASLSTLQRWQVRAQSGKMLCDLL